MIPRFVILAVRSLELQLLKWGRWGRAGLAGKIKSLISGLLSWRCLLGLQVGEWIRHSETQRWTSGGVQGAAREAILIQTGFQGPDEIGK